VPAQGLEFEMEDLLLRNVPGLAEQWQGTTPDAIAEIERLAGRPLPLFYRWFLTRMGQSMGPLAYPRLDFSAQRVLTCYAEKLVTPHPRFLLIGHESDEMMPLHVFYDLDSPARADARVTKRHARGGELHEQFETLREMLAWGAFSRFRVDRMPQRCQGILTCDHPDVLARIGPLMSNLGFRKPISTGPFCGLYERTDSVMVCSGTIRKEPDGIQAFTLGGSNAGTLRRTLGELATESSLEVEVDSWAPALP
jgi:hypothetical protein